MARKAMTALKSKKPKGERRTRTSVHLEEKYIGGEPKWTVQPAHEDYHGDLTKALNFYNATQHYAPKKKDLIQWLETNSKLLDKKPEKAKKKIATFRKSADSWSKPTMLGVAKIANNGLKLTKEHEQYLIGKVVEAIEATDPDLVVETKRGRKKVSADKPTKGLFETIQDRMLEQARSLAGEFDEDMDRVFTKQESTVDVYKYLVENQVTKPVASKMRAMFENSYKEIVESKKPKGDEQLVEAYAGLKGRRLKNVLTWYQKLFADFDNYVKHKNLNRKVRKKKAVSADKLTAKLKYLKEFKKFRLVSVQPKDIVGAEQLWVFNVKSRKLGRYLADVGGALTVRGSTIIGYDEVTSVCKTIRKPEIQLPEFMKAGKVGLRKFLDSVRATATKVKSRTGKDVILLRVV